MQGVRTGKCWCHGACTHIRGGCAGDGTNIGAKTVGPREERTAEAAGAYLSASWCGHIHVLLWGSAPLH